MTAEHVDDHWTEERLWWLQTRTEALSELYGLDAARPAGVPDGPDTIRETLSLLAAYRALEAAARAVLPLATMGLSFALGRQTGARGTAMVDQWRADLATLAALLGDEK